MEANTMSFKPFHDNQEHDSLFDFIIDNEVSRGGLLKRNRATADIIINDANQLIAKGELDGETEESRFVKVFDRLLENQLKNNILN
jgi:hypothetical protein